MPATYKVYCLSNGDDVFYVGCTRKPLDVRLKEHKYAAFNGNSSNGIKNNKIRANSDVVVISELESIVGYFSDALVAEKKWVSRLLSEGKCLCNAVVVPIEERIIEPTGCKSIRISDEAFNQIKEFVDIKGWKLGRFVEDAAMEKLKTEKEKK